MRNKDEFNLIISGVGGQGLITLLKILAEAAMAEGFDVKTSELHGLSQRGGSVGVHLRFGKKIFSPLVSREKADLILVLEKNETLKNCYFASKKNTVFLINDFQIDSPSFQGLKFLKNKEVLKVLKKFSQKAIFVEASKICKEKISKEILAGIFILGFAVFNKFLPLKPESVLKAIKKIIPKEYLKMNKKAFQLAKFSPSPQN